MVFFFFSFRVGVKLPTVEVRYKNLTVEAECEVVQWRPQKLDEFVPQKTSAYISQYDLHIPEMTVRETIDFSARTLSGCWKQSR